MVAKYVGLKETSSQEIALLILEDLLYSCSLIYKIPQQRSWERHKARIICTVSQNGMGIAIFLITWRTICKDIYQVNVLIFMDALFPGVCDDEAFHSHAFILCITIARTQTA